MKSSIHLFFYAQSLLALCLLSSKVFAGDKFYYANPLANNSNDILLLQQKNESRYSQFTGSRLTKLRTQPLLANTKICYKNKHKNFDTIKLNLSYGSDTRTVFLKNNTCSTIDDKWNSYGNIISSFIEKFSGILSPETVSDQFSASYSLGSNRNPENPNTDQQTKHTIPKKPFCLDNYSGIAEIQPKTYKELHIPFKTSYEGSVAVLHALAENNDKPIQAQPIKNGEAVFTNITIEKELTYSIILKNANQEKSSTKTTVPLILKPLDIETIRLKTNDEGIPLFDKKALSGNNKADYDDEFAQVLYDLKLLTNPEYAYFHIYAINDLYIKRDYSNDLFISAILPKISEYKTTYCSQ